MAHLKETEFIDLLDGALPAARKAHVESCEECQAQVDALRSTLECVTAERAGEPSPLLWYTMPARIATAIAEAPDRSWWLRRPALTFATAAAIAIILLGVMVLRLSEPAPSSSSTVVQSAPSSEPAAALRTDDDVEQDEAWAVVRTATLGLDYETAVEAGISPSPGGAESAAMELSSEERAELARLIKEEIRRTGA